MKKKLQYFNAIGLVLLAIFFWQMRQPSQPAPEPAPSQVAAQVSGEAVAPEDLRVDLIATQKKVFLQVVGTKMDFLPYDFQNTPVLSITESGDMIYKGTIVAEKDEVAKALHETFKKIVTQSPFENSKAEAKAMAYEKFIKDKKLWDEYSTLTP